MLWSSSCFCSGSRLVRTAVRSPGFVHLLFPAPWLFIWEILQSQTELAVQTALLCLPNRMLLTNPSGTWFPDCGIRERGGYKGGKEALALGQPQERCEMKPLAWLPISQNSRRYCLLADRNIILHWAGSQCHLQTPCSHIRNSETKSV